MSFDFMNIKSKRYFGYLVYTLILLFLWTLTLIPKEKSSIETRVYSFVCSEEKRSKLDVVVDGERYFGLKKIYPNKCSEYKDLISSELLEMIYYSEGKIIENLKIGKKIIIDKKTRKITNFMLFVVLGVFLLPIVRMIINRWES